MSVAAWIGAVLAAVPLSGAAVDRLAPLEQFAQLTIRESIMIVRVPARQQSAPAVTEYKEKRGPKCVSVADLAGAAVTGADTVDLILRGGKRIRARFKSSCPALEFYKGFYVRPSSDRKICADRDAVHDRAGGECEIDRFRELVPVKH